MFVRRAAAMLLVDCQMAIRSGAWTPTRSANPFPAIATLGAILSSPASDDVVADAADALYAVLGEAMMAGEAVVPGYEQFELADAAPLHLADVLPEAANDAPATLPLPRAA